MRYLGKCFNQNIYWVNDNTDLEMIPEEYWICLCVANKKPDMERFRVFAKMAIEKEVLLFMGCGEYGELLHDTFDEMICILETKENHEKIDMVTTWHDKESLKDTFWQGCKSFYLPERTDYENIKIVCMDLDGVDRTEEFKGYIKDFEMGYIPD